MSAQQSLAVPHARIDTDRLRLNHPIADLITRYGIELRRSGSTLVGRSPFHQDGGRPNLTVFPHVIWNQGLGRGSSSRRSDLWGGGARGGTPLRE
jgi:hypothetical protein